MAIRHLIYILVLIATSVFLSIPSQAQTVIYVNTAAIGADNGTSWTDAYTFLQDALQAAQSGGDVWVAAGTYRPDRGAGIVPGDREASFYAPAGVSLYGGFDGSEQSRELRDWDVNETILSGDLLDNDNDLVTYDNPLRIDNSYHIIRVQDITEKVIVDGFVVTGGMANETGHNRGSGIRIRAYASGLFTSDLVHVSNCVFTKNVSEAGTISVGAASSDGEPAVVIEHSEFRNNWANSAAGIDVIGGMSLISHVLFTGNDANQNGVIRVSRDVMYLTGSTISNNRTGAWGTIRVLGTGSDATLYMWNNKITGNKALGFGEAGVRLGKSRLVSINNVFSGNQSMEDGGAISVVEGNAQIINNVFAFNTSLHGGSTVRSHKSTVSISNSIFYENESPEGQEIISPEPDQSKIAISHSLLQETLPTYVVDGGGLLSGNPFFFDADGADNMPGTLDDDFSLLTSSPAIDAGVNDSLFEDLWDLDEDGDSDELWPTDFLNNVRIFDGGTGTATVDMGAFEFDAPPVIIANEYVQALPVNSPRLQGNYPNPFNPLTTISYSLPRPADVQLEVFDLLGKRVRVLEQGYKASGEHEVTFDATGLPSGIYFYALTAGAFSQTRKMAVVR